MFWIFIIMHIQQIIWSHSQWFSKISKITIQNSNSFLHGNIPIYSPNIEQHRYNTYFHGFCTFPCMHVAHTLQSYDFIELWAGKALTSTCIRKAGRATAALDIEYFVPNPDHPQRSNHFDILTASGFLSPKDVQLSCFTNPRFSWLLIFKILPQICVVYGGKVGLV